MVSARRRLNLSGFGLLLLSGPAGAFSASPAAPGDGVVAVSLFKNGFASITREFAVSGTTLTLDAPIASLGTLFFVSDDGSSVSVEAIPGAGGKRRVPLQTMGDLLRANVGKRVFLRLAEGESGVLEGEIASAGRDVVALKMADGQHILPISRVLELASTKSELRLEVEVPGLVAPRTYRVIKSKPGGHVRMTSLEPGLAWVPSYRIDLSDPKTATVIVGSTIFDEDFDLKGVRARLVSGFPAARYRNVPEPLLARTGLPEWLAAVANPQGQPPLRRDVAVAPANGLVPETIDAISYDPTDNSLVVGEGYASNRFRSSGGYGGGGAIAGANYGYTGVQEGGGTGANFGALFFYEIPPLTLARGVRRQESLFRFDAPYRHVNTFEIGPDYDENLNPVRRNQSDGYQSVGQGYGRPMSEEDQRALREAVWHEVEFENRAGQPLTGAVASVIEDEEMTGQGEVDYTPSGGTVDLRLDRALDLVLNRKEEVVLREPNAVKSTRYTNVDYDRATVRGTITVRNPRKEAVILKGRKRIVGEITIATPGGTITKTDALLNGINGTSVAAWETTIAPGATVTLSYTYLLLLNR